MKRPSVGSLFWFAAFVGVSYLLFQHLQGGAVGKEESAIKFDDHVYFYDWGDNLYISGRLAGDNVRHKNNAVVITCDKPRMQCIFSAVYDIGSNLIDRLDPHSVYPVTKWNAVELVASNEGSCQRETITIARKPQGFVWVHEPINLTSPMCKDAITQIYKWKIEGKR